MTTPRRPCLFACKTEGPPGPIWCSQCGHDPRCCNCDDDVHQGDLRALKVIDAKLPTKYDEIDRPPGKDKVRFRRTIEYEGPRAWVEETIRRSIRFYRVCDGKTVREISVEEVTDAPQRDPADQPSVVDQCAAGDSGPG